MDDTKDVKETETSSYRFNHSMIRIKDAERSLKFYQDVMGMTLLRVNEQKEAKFTLYFLGYHDKPDESTSPNGVNPVAGNEGVRLLYNHTHSEVLTSLSDSRAYVEPWRRGKRRPGLPQRQQ